MGELVHGVGDHKRLVDAFRCIVERMSDGVILTGTRSAEHLRQNVEAFEQATKAVAAGSTVSSN
jgi:hypothetical protein